MCRDEDAAARPRPPLCAPAGRSGDRLVAERLERGRDAASVARVEEFDTGLALAELDPERPRPVETPWGSFALYVVEGDVLASQSFCPHLEGPLFQGTRSGETITCPWHLWRFSLRTGERLDAGGLLSRGRDALLVCDVRVGPRGTLVLSRPRPAAADGR